MIRRVKIVALVVAMPILASAADTFDQAQFEQMVTQASEQFVVRKNALKSEIRSATFRALVSAYIGGLFDGDFVPVRLAKAFAERDWQFFARVIAGHTVAMGELIAASAALHELYQVASTERQFDRMLQDLFAERDAQSILQQKLNSEDFVVSDHEKDDDFEPLVGETSQE